MPNELAHIARASRNQQAIAYLLEGDDVFPEWVTAIAFYKALHIVEAILAGSGVHSPDHGERERTLKRTNEYKKIYEHYAPLCRASLIARYLQDKGSKAYVAFENFRFFT